MRESWRWFGEADPVTLDDIRQAGATDVVCALYDIPAGEVWPLERIRALKQLIERDDDNTMPLTWSVVESIPVHEDIKLGRSTRDEYIDSWAETLRNLATSGIDVVCYNFMPVIDWTRTNLAFRMPSGALALRFDQRECAVFDLHILQRQGAERDYSASELELAQRDFEAMPEAKRRQLTENIIAGLPGKMTDSYDLDTFRVVLHEYDDVSREDLERNLDYFLERVVPVASEHGIRLAIHPDDPPWSLFGLPRVVCNSSDLTRLLDRHSEGVNGIALCAGTLGSHIDNDVVEMAQVFGARVHFAHLRSISHDADEPRSFVEASHLEGDVDLVRVLRILREHEKRRTDDRGNAIFIRPDHGHQMMDDLDKTVNPGYSGIGRLKGLAEIRGVLRALEALDSQCEQ